MISMFLKKVYRRDILKTHAKNCRCFFYHLKIILEMAVYEF